MTGPVLSIFELADRFFKGEDLFVPDMPDISMDDFEDVEELSERELKEFDQAFYEDIVNGRGFGIPDDEGNVFHDPEEYEAYHGKLP